MPLRENKTSSALSISSLDCFTSCNSAVARHLNRRKKTQYESHKLYSRHEHASCCLRAC